MSLSEETRIKHGKEIVWICQECGEKYCNGPQFEVSTWHMDVCDVCMRYGPCTEPRDFGHIKAEFGHQSRGIKI